MLHAAQKIWLKKWIFLVTDGDGTLLGAVYVLGPGDQGVLFEHREGTFGDNVNTTEVMAAVNKMKKLT